MLPGRDLLFIEAAELWHLDEEHGGADLGDAWDGAQNSEALGQIRIALDQRVDFCINSLSLRVNLLQAGGVLALEKGQRDGFGPGLGRDLILDQGVACRAQIPEIIDHAICAFQVRRRHIWLMIL